MAPMACMRKASMDHPSMRPDRSRQHATVTCGPRASACSPLPILRKASLWRRSYIEKRCMTSFWRMNSTGTRSVSSHYYINLHFLIYSTSISCITIYRYFPTLYAWNIQSHLWRRRRRMYRSGGVGRAYSTQRDKLAYEFTHRFFSGGGY